MNGNILNFVKHVKLNHTTGCWEWLASKTKFGYGQFQNTQSHRWIYQYVHNKVLPIDIVVCHTCDNPSCVNPKHLWQGTQKQNIQDMFNKKRNPPPTRGELDGMAKLTAQKVKQIRTSPLSGKELARLYDVTPQTICDIRKRRSWRHI